MRECDSAVVFRLAVNSAIGTNILRAVLRCKLDLYSNFLSPSKLTALLMGSTAFALVLAIILALLLEYFRRLEEYRPDDYQRALRFINAYFGWLPGVRQTSAKR